jgi:hypothetical protein
MSPGAGTRQCAFSMDAGEMIAERFLDTPAIKVAVCANSAGKSGPCVALKRIQC